ncbi:MAG: hypothetical protein LBJ71_02860 [Holosporaceae bacterium]|jgi:hypothetical protein|nr:hypothetical protein [Holosporaceae bacterium]
MKIIWECVLCYHRYQSGDWQFSDGRLCRQVPIGEALGFYLLSPKTASARREDFFNTVIIFTPKSGLFYETPPE